MKLHTGDSLDILRTLPDDSVDSIVTDPPYELGFMGKAWDSSGIAYSIDLIEDHVEIARQRIAHVTKSVTSL